MKKTILLFLLFSLVSTKGMAKGGDHCCGQRCHGKDVGTVKIKPLLPASNSTNPADCPGDTHPFP